MDVVSSLVNYINDADDYVHAFITASLRKHLDADVPIYYANNPPSLIDYPDDYAFILVSRDAPKRFAMCHNSFSVGITVVCEINCSIAKLEATNNASLAVVSDLLQTDLDYNINLTNQATVSRLIKSGKKVVTTFDLTLKINL